MSYAGLGCSYAKLSWLPRPTFPSSSGFSPARWLGQKAMGAQRKATEVASLEMGTNVTLRELAPESEAS